MTNSPNAAVDVATSHLKPIPEHLYDAVVGSLRSALGSDWGKPTRRSSVAVRSLLHAALELENVHVASSPNHPHREELRIDLWVDRDDLDTGSADEVVTKVLQGLGNREILIICRAYEDQAIVYQFASGTVDLGLIGTIGLVGPYARDLARLARIGSGQSIEFSA